MNAWAWAEASQHGGRGEDSLLYGWDGHSVQDDQDEWRRVVRKRVILIRHCVILIHHCVILIQPIAILIHQIVIIIHQIVIPIHLIVILIHLIAILIHQRVILIHPIASSTLAHPGHGHPPPCSRSRSRRRRRSGSGSRTSPASALSSTVLSRLTPQRRCLSQQHPHQRPPRSRTR